MMKCELKPANSTWRNTGNCTRGTFEFEFFSFSLICISVFHVHIDMLCVCYKENHFTYHCLPHHKTTRENRERECLILLLLYQFAWIGIGNECGCGWCDGGDDDSDCGISGIQLVCWWRCNSLTPAYEYIHCCTCTRYVWYCRNRNTSLFIPMMNSVVITLAVWTVRGVFVQIQFD